MTTGDANPDENEQNVYFMVKMMTNISEMKGKKNKLYLIVCVKIMFGVKSDVKGAQTRRLDD